MCDLLAFLLFPRETANDQLFQWPQVYGTIGGAHTDAAGSKKDNYFKNNNKQAHKHSCNKNNKSFAALNLIVVVDQFVC